MSDSGRLTSKTSSETYKARNPNMGLTTRQPNPIPQSPSLQHTNEDIGHAQSNIEQTRRTSMAGYASQSSKPSRISSLNIGRDTKVIVQGFTGKAVCSSEFKPFSFLHTFFSCFFTSTAMHQRLDNVFDVSICHCPESMIIPPDHEDPQQKQAGSLVRLSNRQYHHTNTAHLSRQHPTL